MNIPKKSCLATLSLLLVLSGCAMTTATPEASVKAADAGKAPASKVVAQDPELAVTTAEVVALLNGPEANSYQIIDARPAMKYDQGHVPGALSIPKAVLAENLDKLTKDKTIIFYCGGLKCELSSKSAEIAMANGFSQVKVWYEGMPSWKKAGNFAEIELAAVEKLVLNPGKDPYLLIDARPAMKYQKSFIPGALSLPKAEFDLKKGLLPVDKATPLVFYCGGYKCDLSRQSATLALQEGYTNVSVFAAGAPVWKQAGLPLWGNDASGIVAKAAPSEGLPEAIKPEEFQKLMATGQLFLVDVRSAEDYTSAHLPGAIHIYDEDFIHKADESVAKLPDSGRVVLYCSTGSRAGGAYYAILGEADYSNKNNLQYLDAAVTIATDGSYSIKKL